MSAERDELAHLVQAIPDDQVPQVLVVLRRYLRPAGKCPWPPPWFGIAAGDGTAVGARSEELLDASFGHSR